MNYPPEVKEYIRVKCEQSDNNAAIARDVVKQFKLDTLDENVRKAVARLRLREKIKAKQLPIKRLFFDIETTYYLARVWDTGKQYIRHDQLIDEKKIICVSYKWQGEDKVHTLKWDKNQDDKKMVRDFIKIMGQADEIVGHNSDNFDIKEMRTRALKHGLLMFPTYRSLDTCKKARQYFNFPSNSLEYITKFVGGDGKTETGGFPLWVKIKEGKCKESMKTMVTYCENDVIILEDDYTAMAPYIWHNTNFAVLTGGSLWECPECASKRVEMYRTYTTPMGVIRRNMKCDDCSKQYRISNKTYLAMIRALYNEG